jgi:hypothetical protein
MSSGEHNDRGGDGKELEADGLDFCRYDEIARLAELAASYWKSTALAADRGDVLTVITHCRQAAAVTREAFALVKELGNAQGPSS